MLFRNTNCGMKVLPRISYFYLTVSQIMAFVLWLEAIDKHGAFQGLTLDLFVAEVLGLFWPCLLE